MENYKANSHKSRELASADSHPEGKTEKIVIGPVKQKKKSEIRKLADVFLYEDIVNVKQYILYDVVIPMIKSGILDTFYMLFYGETGRSRESSRISSKPSYVKYYDKVNGRRNEIRPNDRSMRTYDDLIFPSRAEANEVLNKMEDYIKHYDAVRVADLYEMIGYSGDYTDNKYGWTDLRSATIVRERDGGYLLKLPKAKPFD